ncbi:MAG TPA: right-handed parallel beta-helix repeat-containing protein, partial [Clostridia bacterium]|nr:right-handed parallel beta-helix repeat-containing protein [Clostridia bacterium]
MNYLPLAHVDEAEQYAVCGIPSSYALMPRGKRPTLAVENVLEYLTGPGQWAVDTRRRKAYLWPRTEKPEGVVYPCLRQMVLVEGVNDFEGDEDVPVNGLIFSGLTFMHADRALWNLTDAGIQHDYELYDKDSALLRFRGAERCGVERCAFLHSGGSAIRFDLYAKECFAIGNTIREMGQCGVTVIGHGPGTKDVNQCNAVVDNEIAEVAALYTQSPGIVVCQSGRNRIAHNELHDMPRKAILLTGTRLHMYQERYRRNQREVVRAIRWREIQGPMRVW